MPSGLVTKAQEGMIDPGRVLTTQLDWQRSSDSRSNIREARGSLAILYLDGTYAEVSTSFAKVRGTIQLDMKHGFSVRLGTWTRADEGIIRLESKEVVRDKATQPTACGTNQDCAAEPGPSIAHTCSVEGGTANRVASALYCKGLVLVQPSQPTDLMGLPQIVQQLVAGKKGPTKTVAMQ
jgi:hypothetical protein